MIGAGCQSMVAPIREILVADPAIFFQSESHVDRWWRELGYRSRPDRLGAKREFDALVVTLEDAGIRVHQLERVGQATLDAIYVRDAALMTERGALLCNMGKPARRDEPALQEAFVKSRGGSIAGRVQGPGLLEGGDVVWLDRNSVAIGVGYRTNRPGVEQFARIVGGPETEVTVVPLPHWNGPGDVMHLMSLVSPVDNDLFLVYSRLMPVPFRQELLSRGITLVEVPDSEFETMGCNVLALAPRKCLALEGNPITRARLEREGVEVLLYRGDEISRKGCGGPTCLTQPLVRGSD